MTIGPERPRRPQRLEKAFTALGQCKSGQELVVLVPSDGKSGPQRALIRSTWAHRRLFYKTRTKVFFVVNLKVDSNLEGRSTFLMLFIRASGKKGNQAAFLT